MTSRARQPLPLSASMVMDLIFFMTLGMAENLLPFLCFSGRRLLAGRVRLAEDPPLLQVIGDTGQVEIQQRLLGGNAVAVKALELVVRIQQFRFQFGKALLPMVFRRFVVGTPHSASPVGGAQQGPVSRGRLPDPGFVEVDAGPRRNETGEIVDVV